MAVARKRATAPRRKSKRSVKRAPARRATRNPSSGALMSERAPEPVGAYPHARRVGNLLFLSGIGPRQRGRQAIPGVVQDAGGGVIGHDIEAQCRSVFRNIRSVLEDSGSSWERIVDVTVFLTDMRRDFPVFNRIYAEHFTDNRPARTTVEVTRLPTPIAIELKVIATVGSGRGSRPQATRGRSRRMARTGLPS